MPRTVNHNQAWSAWRDLQHVLDASPDNSIVDENGDRVHFTAPQEMRGGKLGGDLFAHNQAKGLQPYGTYRIDTHGNMVIEPAHVAVVVNARLAARREQMSKAGVDPFHFNWDED